MGFCIGVVSGIARTAPHLEPKSRFCLPANSTREEQLAMVIQYLEDHPERLQEDFFVLALQAFQETWPCPALPPAMAKGSASQPSASSSDTPIGVTSQASSRGNGAPLEEGQREEQAGLAAKSVAPAKVKQPTKQRPARVKPQRTEAKDVNPREIKSLSPFELFVLGLLPPANLRHP